MSPDVDRVKEEVVVMMEEEEVVIGQMMSRDEVELSNDRCSDVSSDVTPVILEGDR